MENKDKYRISLLAFITSFVRREKWILRLARNEIEKSKKCDTIDESIESEKERVKIRMSIFKKKIISTIILIGSALIGAVLVSNVITQKNIESNLLKSIFNISSLCFFTFGTVCRLGWEGQSWKGNSVFEQLDHRMFLVAYFCGTFLGITAILM